MSWFTKSAATFLKKFVRAFWDSVSYLWDDTDLPWDAQGSDDWKTKQEGIFSTRASSKFATKNDGTWQRKN